DLLVKADCFRPPVEPEVRGRLSSVNSTGRFLSSRTPRPAPFPKPGCCHEPGLESGYHADQLLQPSGKGLPVPRLTQQQLEAHLWGAANILRGRTAGQDYKTYILSLMFFKRLSDQWDFEADDKIDQLERERARPFTDAQRQALRSRGDLHRF